MLTKSKLAISAALLLSVVSVAQAASENPSDPVRGAPFGPYGQWMGGSAVNPVMHRSTRALGPYAYARYRVPRGYASYGFVPARPWW